MFFYLDIIPISVSITDNVINGWHRGILPKWPKRYNDLTENTQSTKLITSRQGAVPKYPVVFYMRGESDSFVLVALIMLVEE